MLRDEVVDEGLQSYFAFLLNESAYDIRRHRFSTTIAHSSLRASKLLRRNRDSDLCGGHTRIIPRRSWPRKERRLELEARPCCEGEAGPEHEQRDQTHEPRAEAIGQGIPQNVQHRV